MFINPDVLSRASDSNMLLVFVHCQRTGGSEFGRWIRRAFSPDDVYSKDLGDQYEPLHAIKDVSVLDRYKLVTGFSFHRELKPERAPIFLTNVRHPFFRVVSLYHMSKRSTGHFLHDVSRDGSFEEFYIEGLKRRAYYFNDFMCKRIAGTPDYDRALTVMQEDFGLVGTTNNLTDMCQILADKLSLDLDPLPPNGKRPDAEEYARYLESPIYDTVMENNQNDVKLFEFVDTLPLDNRTKEMRRAREASLRIESEKAMPNKISEPATAASPAEIKSREAALLKSMARQDDIFEKLRAQNPDIHFGQHYAQEAFNGVREGKEHATLGANLRNKDWETAGVGVFKRYSRMFDFKPTDKVVDYGCGSLRVGSQFIRFLDKNCYVGLDIVPGFYEIGQDLLGQDIMENKAPRFGEILAPGVIEDAATHGADYVFSSAVAYHLHPDNAAEYFENLQSLASKPGCTVFFDASISDAHFRYRQRSWSWPLSFYEEMLPELEFVEEIRIKQRHEFGHDFWVGLLVFKRPLST